MIDSMLTLGLWLIGCNSKDQGSESGEGGTDKI